LLSRLDAETRAQQSASARTMAKGGRAALLAVIQAHAETIAGVAILDANLPLAQYGFSSVQAAEFASYLGDLVGRALPGSFVRDHPSIGELTDALLGELGAAAPPVALVPSSDHEPIAIVGMGCRLPGADNPTELWRALREGQDACGEIPADRFDIERFYDP